MRPIPFMKPHVPATGGVETLEEDNFQGSNSGSPPTIGQFNSHLTYAQKVLPNGIWTVNGSTSYTIKRVIVSLQQVGANTGDMFCTILDNVPGSPDLPGAQIGPTSNAVPASSPPTGSYGDIEFTGLDAAVSGDYWIAIQKIVRDSSAIVIWWAWNIVEYEPATGEDTVQRAQFPTGASWTGHRDDRGCKLQVYAVV